jgi:hypothetical protein
MTFRYRLRTDDGREFIALSIAEYDVLVDRLLAENPGRQLVLVAELVRDGKEGER